MTKIKKTVLDKDLKKFRRLESASHEAGVQAFKIGLGLLLLLGLYIFAALGIASDQSNPLVVAAIVIGGYMALNIGANDVANTMGPAVASKALTMFGALIIAGFFTVAGAVIAGGDVVSTVSKGIIDPSAVGDAQTFIWAMLAALLAAAVWVNLATYVGAPVSTTHAIVGGVMGAGISASSFSAVDWGVMSAIAASWVISPLLGGIIAAAILFSIKKLILYQDDKITAAKRWVPLFVAVMTGVFSAYLVMKGLKKIWQPGGGVITLIGIAAFFIGWATVNPVVQKASKGLENSRKSVARLFVTPLIGATALLSFAHGANDVANAIGPLAAILDASSSGGISAKVSVPLWVMVMGGVGIAMGLAMFGPKMIKKVGEKITKLNIIRAYAVALAAAITVIIASALGLPVSSTHVAIGAIFGVGFLREALARKSMVEAATNSRILLHAKSGGRGDAPALTKDDLKALKKFRKRKLVRRRYFFSIIAAWLVTVPLAALLGAMFFYMLKGMLSP
ncbi:MAG: inorganic phosphate transporter [Sphingomonadales bacterium]